MNQFGNNLRIQIMGESHGAGIGVTLDGVPAGMPLREAEIQAALDRRRPGQSKLTTARQEADQMQWQTGNYNGLATGAPIHGWIDNQDQRSKDYSELARKPRPGHADYPNHVASHGFDDIRGGGHNSGRLTAALVAAGEAVQPILDAFGVTAGAYLETVGKLSGKTDASASAMAASFDNQIYALKNSTAMAEAIDAARKNRDSIGGTVAFAIDDLPVGLGDPFFDSLEAMAAKLLFSVPAVKGIEFGAGFASTTMPGSEHNDAWETDGKTVKPRSNHAGGALGGRSSGAPFTGRIAIKPTSSIFQPQETVDLVEMAATNLEIKGRHDPCIAIRAVPVVRGCMQILAAEWLLGGIKSGLLENPWT